MEDHMDDDEERDLERMHQRAAKRGAELRKQGRNQSQGTPQSMIRHFRRSVTQRICNTTKSAIVKHAERTYNQLWCSKAGNLKSHLSNLILGSATSLPLDSEIFLSTFVSVLRCAGSHEQ